MFQWIFPNPSLRSALIYLRSLDSEFANQVTWRSLRTRTRKNLTDHAKAVENAVIVHDAAPQMVVLNIIVALAERDLTSGQQHIFRGTLSNVGHSTFAVLRKALDLSVMRGLPMDEARGRLEEIEQGMKAVG